MQLTRLLIDLAALAVLVVGVRHGWRDGATGIATRVVGTVLGLLFGAWLATHVLPDHLGGPERFGLGLLLVLGVGLVGHRIGAALGPRAWGAGREGPVRMLNRSGGAVLGGVVAAGVAGVLLLACVAWAPLRWADATRASAAYTALRPAGTTVWTDVRGAVSTVPGDLRTGGASRWERRF